MHTSRLTPDELRQALRFLSAIAIKRCPPGFDLRGLLVACFRDDFPDTAAKLESFDDRQVQALCEELMELQKAHRDGSPPP
jgi:hypothetical protein